LGQKSQYSNILEQHTRLSQFSSPSVRDRHRIFSAMTMSPMLIPHPNQCYDVFLMLHESSPARDSHTRTIAYDVMGDFMSLYHYPYTSRFYRRIRTFAVPTSAMSCQTRNSPLKSRHFQIQSSSIRNGVFLGQTADHGQCSAPVFHERSCACKVGVGKFALRQL
jgi:hypothetical protein